MSGRLTQEWETILMERKQNGRELPTNHVTQVNCCQMLWPQIANQSRDPGKLLLDFMVANQIANQSRDPGKLLLDFMAANCQPITGPR
jgi:hypothetical protein